jgi:putative peptidoglycan lipid II flippase
MTIRLPRFISRSNELLEQQQASILSAAFIITGASILSGLFGILRNRILVGYFYGLPVLDAYWVSFRLPELVFQILVIGTLSSAFIPVFTKYEKISKSEAFRMASTVLNLILISFVLLSTIVFIFAEPLTRAMTGESFTDQQVQVSAQLTQVMIFAQFFFAISNFLSGTIQSYKRFIIPALSPIAYNLGIIIGTILLSPRFGIMGPAMGVVIGAFLHVILQIPLAIKLGFQYYPRLDFSHPGVKEICKLMIPRTLTISVNQLQLFATTFFATHLALNSVSILYLAQALMTFPIRIFGAPIGQAALPFLSKESNGGDFVAFKKLMFQSLHQISFFAFPASVMMLILRVPIVRLTLGDPNFPWSATILTGKVVAVFAFSIAAQASVHILIRAFYALHDTKRPLAASLISTAIFMAMSIFSVFFSTWGVMGLAIALTVSTVTEMVLLLLLLNQQIPILNDKAFWIPQIKMFAASFLMAVFLWLPFRIFDELIFDTTRTIDLIGLTISVGTIGMLTYIMFAYLLEIKELHMIFRLFEGLGNWKNTLSRTTEVVETAGQTDESVL